MIDIHNLQKAGIFDQKPSQKRHDLRFHVGLLLQPADENDLASILTWCYSIFEMA